MTNMPIPKLVVFYNGEKERPEETILQLSDAFDPKLDASCADITVRVRMLNINKGRNKALLDTCKPLKEYAWFVQSVRDNVELKGRPVNTDDRKAKQYEAIDEAIDEMPDDFVIKPYLIAHRSEVKMDIYDDEYFIKLHIESEKKISFEEGERLGRQEGEEERPRLQDENDKNKKALADKDNRLQVKDEQLQAKDEQLQAIKAELAAEKAKNAKFESMKGGD